MSSIDKQNPGCSKILYGLNLPVRVSLCITFHFIMSAPLPNIRVIDVLTYNAGQKSFFLHKNGITDTIGRNYFSFGFAYRTYFIFYYRYATMRTPISRFGHFNYLPLNLRSATVTLGLYRRKLPTFHSC